MAVLKYPTEKDIRQRIRSYYDRMDIWKACSHGLYYRIRKLLENGTDPNMRDNLGHTPICYLLTTYPRHTGEYSTDILKLFVDFGANINIKNIQEDSMLMISAYYLKMRSARFLIEQGIDVNSANKNGDRALSYAVCMSGLDMVKMLLEHGADPNYKSKCGITLLEVTRSYVHDDEKYGQITEILRQYGAR